MTGFIGIIENVRLIEPDDPVPVSHDAVQRRWPRSHRARKPKIPRKKQQQLRSYGGMDKKAGWKWVKWSRFA